MNVAANLKACSGIWRGNAAASHAALAQLRSDAPLELPATYLDLLAASNGGEGDLGVEPGWISFWPAESVIESNRSYSVEASLSGLVGFGSNGGGELLAFDTRTGPPHPIVAVPFIPLDLAEVRVIAPDFDSLAALVGISLPAD